ncbi:hypothetical protein Taro_021964, partial [Colocasia esculenta]|nr:hypothetical protein [Colocasia esculenta]
IRACLGWPTALLRVRACLLLAGLVVGYKPAVRRGFIVLPRLFARCLALEGLSRSEVVSIAWDPHPREPLRERSRLRACSSWQPTGRTLELRGKRGLDSGAELFVELSWLGLGHRGRPEFYPVSWLASLLSHCLTLCWFWSRVWRSGVRPQLGQAVVLCALVCFCGGSVSPFRGGRGMS